MVPKNFDTKKLRTLPTKEIKVFHSTAGVGLAYTPSPQRRKKNRIFFRQVTLVVGDSLDLEFPDKRAVFPSGYPILYQFNPGEVECLVIFFSYSPRLVIHVQSHAHCENAVLPNADRKK